MNKIKELVVISGKGGTGKTSIAASLAVLTPKAVLADCDVEASNLHILLTPQTIAQNDFFSGKTASINQPKCLACGICVDHCRFNAIIKTPAHHFQINPFLCEGCGLCVRLCPNQAIDFNENLCGKLLTSQTADSFLIHAQMEPMAENSGKLVTQVRQTAREIARKNQAQLIIIDGPPGIGCPAIASITGADKILIIAEPTISGFHDLKRVLTLVNHFKIPCFVCINKWDLNEEMTLKIEKEAQNSGAVIIGRVSYSKAFFEAQIKGKTVMEINSATADEIKQIWQTLNYQGE